MPRQTTLITLHIEYDSKHNAHPKEWDWQPLVDGEMSVGQNHHDSPEVSVVGWEDTGPALREFAVTVICTDGEHEDGVYQAEDFAHAIEQAENEFPDCRIAGVTDTRAFKALT